MNQSLVELVPEFTVVLLLGVAGFLLAMLLTPLYTYFAYRYRFWKVQRTETVSGDKVTIMTMLHANKFKRNIPTMAGLIFVAVVTLITLIVNLDRQQTLLPLLSLLGGAAIGLIDDIINLKGFGGGVKGLRAPIKFSMISVIGLLAGMYFFYRLGYSDVHIPFIGPFEIGWLIIPLFAFVVVATSNAVNISDGLDGLAGGLAATAYAAFGTIALLQGNFGIAGFCFTVVGALFSYIWFNIYPARFFMGDIGSFALGTGLGVVAMLTDTLFLLPIIGIMFVVEAGSSLIQICSKKFLHRKVFVSAPIHHHLEAGGWPETKITMRFWIIAQVAAFLGIFLALAGGHLTV